MDTEIDDPKYYKVYITAQVRSLSGSFEVEAEDEFEAREKGWEMFIETVPSGINFVDNNIEVTKIE